MARLRKRFPGGKEESNLWFTDKASAQIQHFKDAKIENQPAEGLCLRCLHGMTLQIPEW